MDGSSDLIDYQLALARMDVRDGKMREDQYLALLGSLDELYKTLASITDANGLDNALRQIEIRKYESLYDFNKKYKEEKFFPKYTPRNLKSLLEPNPFFKKERSESEWKLKSFIHD